MPKSKTNHAKKARFALPAPNPSLSHHRTVLARLQDCIDILESWRLTIGPQTPRHHKNATPCLYSGAISMQRSSGTATRFSMGVNTPYVASAHTELRLAGIEEKARTAFVAFEQALLAVPAFQSPLLGLGITGYAPVSPTDLDDRIYMTGFGLNMGYRTHATQHLRTVLALLDGVSITPTDPVWMIKNARIPAPDAATALLIHHVMGHGAQALKVSPKGGTPIVRLDETIATYTQAAEHLAARKAALGLST